MIAFFSRGDEIVFQEEIQRLFPRKLRSRWLVPYTVSQVFLHGALEASKEDGTTFIVNGQHAKHYEEGLLQGKGTYKNDKAGLTLADLAYRRAKAVQNHQKKSNKSNPLPKPSSSRLEEMRELFQSDVKDKKPKRRAVTSAAMLMGCSSQELITALSTHKIQPCERGHCCHKFDIIAGIQHDSLRVTDLIIPSHNM
ncbi:unnamed protein product [Trifolium pratense]|uniref:Uncharacterized protein n=1 Tax=Trifolium pratense TaxID=57577 RepID=A0ACB0KLF4_TRIPR|nr:unnamed protein product [Trifolium pratense]